MTWASGGRAIRRCTSGRGRKSISAHGSSSTFRELIHRATRRTNRNRISRDGALRSKAKSGAWWRFEIDRELEGENPWRDVYANYQQFDVVQVQGGKFKLPFSLDENTSPTNLDFVYRSLAARVLAPGRDSGVMVHGRVAQPDRPLRARHLRARRPQRADAESGARLRRPHAGGTHRRAAVPDVEDAWPRICWSASPSRRAMCRRGFGSLRGQTTFGETFFEPDVWVQGRRERTGFELRWRPGPLSVKAEYMRVTDERLGQSVEDTDLSPLARHGLVRQRHLGRSPARKKPTASTCRTGRFLRGGFGAVEVAARLEELTFGSVGDRWTRPRSSVRADVDRGQRSDRVRDVRRELVSEPVGQASVQRDQGNARPRRAGPGRSPNRSSWSRVLPRFQFTL